MNSTLTRYETALRPLSAVIDAVPERGWASASPCAGWTVRDVLTHLVDTQREFLVGRGVELGETPDFQAHPAAAWRTHAKQVSEALADEKVPATAYDGYFGPTTLGETLEQFYIWDMVVHRWDIATAGGADATLSDAELDQIDSGATRFGDNLYAEGVCGPAVEAPDGADRQTRVLARLGRVSARA